MAACPGPWSSTAGAALIGKKSAPALAARGEQRCTVEGRGMWPGPRKRLEDAADQQLQPGAGPAVPAAGLRPLCQRVLRAPPDGPCRPAGAVHDQPHKGQDAGGKEPSEVTSSIQDIAVLFNVIIIFLMFFNTFVFQAGLVSLLFRKFKGTIILTAVYFALSIALHVWVMNLRWKNSQNFVWTNGLQALFVLQRLAVLYCYFYKRTAMRLGDPRFYRDSLWLRKEFLQGSR
ncbi:PREDICTED: transmembrane protein 138 isoform X2 [Chinchilla lanigera]|uniref:transmembrane protein 138 isoform X2 n=1 Tax=Chinchilla lanigera TaxID=34839 RepID=UPI000697B091|nr:PREDICTED: transmembrane protein 138 isoform X2 [Chinchilla lanigera]